MKLERNYLTADEIGVVVNAMLSKDNEYERQMAKYGVVAQLLNLVEVKDGMDCSDMYTELVKNGIDLDTQVINLYLVDKIVDKEFGVAKTVGAILSGVIEQADEALKSIDPKAMLVELQKLQNK
jgi:hypothetical protein